MSGGETRVFLHGVGGGHAAWRDQLPYFAARGYRAVAWDQPGYAQAESVWTKERDGYNRQMTALQSRMDSATAAFERN